MQAARGVCSGGAGSSRVAPAQWWGLTGRAAGGRALLWAGASQRSVVALACAGVLPRCLWSPARWERPPPCVHVYSAAAAAVCRRACIVYECMSLHQQTAVCCVAGARPVLLIRTQHTSQKQNKMCGRNARQRRVLCVARRASGALCVRARVRARVCVCGRANFAGVCAVCTRTAADR